MLRTRKARVSDLAALIAIERAAFPRPGDAPMSVQSIRRLVASPSAAVLIAERDRRAIGSAIVLFRRTSTIARLYSMGVLPSDTGCGAGSLLLVAAERTASARGCNAMRLEVREKNKRAISLYDARGYARFGRHTHYYPDGAAALRYEKVLGRADASA
jgi:ribosomal-protein-alanine N-acetyltransferase